MIPRRTFISSLSLAALTPRTLYAPSQDAENAFECFWLSVLSESIPVLESKATRTFSARKTALTQAGFMKALAYVCNQQRIDIATYSGTFHPVNIVSHPQMFSVFLSLFIGGLSEFEGLSWFVRENCPSSVLLLDVDNGERIVVKDLVV